MTNTNITQLSQAHKVLHSSMQDSVLTNNKDTAKQIYNIFKNTGDFSHSRIFSLFNRATGIELNKFNKLMDV